MLGATADLLLVLFGGISLAAQPGLYVRGLVLLGPGGGREKARKAVEACGRALSLWLLGQLVSMYIGGALTTVGLWLVGVPLALALGLLSGLAEFVPIVGPIAAAVPGLLLAFSRDMTMTVWVLAVYLGIQQIESNMLLPLIERRLVSLPPALTLFAVVAMGMLLGPLGALFATPLTVVAFVLVRMLYLRETLGVPVPMPGEDAAPSDRN